MGNNNEDKLRALDAALGQIEKQYGKGAVMKLGDSAANMNVETIPTGSLSLDIALGLGGVPKGRIIEVYGPESSGKTTVALHMVAEVQKRGGIAGFIDAEQGVVDKMSYISDSVIEIDVEAELPDSYVQQPAEKLRLYRELDTARNEEMLKSFEAKMIDRFGPLPRPAAELLNVVRLRWEAVRLGMERVKVKNGLMIVHFVGDDDSPYYKSDTFMELLRKVTQRPDRFVLKQHNNRLAMTVRGIKDVAAGYEVLKSL